MTTRSFHLGTILTAATGIFCTPEGMADVYRLCDWMTGDANATHQLPRVSRECEAEIFRQHPDLREVDLREGFKPPFGSKDEGMAWLAEVTRKYGECREIAPLRTDDHTSINPIAEAKMMNPDMEVVEL